VTRQTRCCHDTIPSNHMSKHVAASALRCFVASLGCVVASTPTQVDYRVHVGCVLHGQRALDCSSEVYQKECEMSVNMCVGTVSKGVSNVCQCVCIKKSLRCLSMCV